MFGSTSFMYSIPILFTLITYVKKSLTTLLLISNVHRCFVVFDISAVCRLTFQAGFVADVL